MAKKKPASGKRQSNKTAFPAFDPRPIPNEQLIALKANAETAISNGICLNLSKQSDPQLAQFNDAATYLRLFSFAPAARMFFATGISQPPDAVKALKIQHAEPVEFGTCSSGCYATLIATLASCVHIAIDRAAPDASLELWTPFKLSSDQAIRVWQLLEPQIGERSTIDQRLKRLWHAAENEYRRAKDRLDAPPGIDEVWVHANKICITLRKFFTALVAIVERQKVNSTTAEEKADNGNPSPRLAVNVDTLTATLDGKAIPLGSEQAARWVKVLSDHPGKFISSTDLKNYDSDLDGARTTRLKRSLPPKIKKLVESNTRQGSRVVLV